MKIVVVGSGAREHALQKQFADYGHTVVVTPGRAGIPGSTDTPSEELDADLFVIGPEDPLVNGLADRLRAQDKLVFGPGAKDARLEGDKAFMKDLLVRAGVPTAFYSSFSQGSELDVERFIYDYPGPWAIKTAYLAAGKGVLVTSNPEEAIADAKAKLQKGDIVIEEALDGDEMSFFAVCSGTGWVLLPSARDYKRQLDGDEGPNTGGMGSFTPVNGGPSLDELAAIINPVLAKLEDFRGVLFGGLMLTSDGPYVLEFNIRFGDPEIQSILPTLTFDFGELLADAAAGATLPYQGFVPSQGAAVTVVLASENYPVQPVTGDVISGIEAAEEEIRGVTVYHAGTSVDGEGNFVTAGGRVLSVTAEGETVEAAQLWAYKAADCITWRGQQHRSDIGT